MVRAKTEKSATCCAVAVMAVLFALDVDPGNGGVYEGCPWWHCLTWMWLHGNWVHVLLNAWALIQIVFGWEVRWRSIAEAVGVAMVWSWLCREGVTVCGGEGEVIVGMSGVIYALAGVEALRQGSWNERGYMMMMWLASIAVTAAVGWIVGRMAWEAHLECYCLGVAMAFLHYRY